MNGSGDTANSQSQIVNETRDCVITVLISDTGRCCLFSFNSWCVCIKSLKWCWISKEHFLFAVSWWAYRKLSLHQCETEKRIKNLIILRQLLKHLLSMRTHERVFTCQGESRPRPPSPPSSPAASHLWCDLWTEPPAHTHGSTNGDPGFCLIMIYIIEYKMLLRYQVLFF